MTQPRVTAHALSLPKFSFDTGLKQKGHWAHITGFPPLPSNAKKKNINFKKKSIHKKVKKITLYISANMEYHGLGVLGGT